MVRTKSTYILNFINSSLGYIKKLECTNKIRVWVVVGGFGPRSPRFNFIWFVANSRRITHRRLMVTSLFSAPWVPNHWFSPLCHLNFQIGDYDSSTNLFLSTYKIWVEARVHERVEVLRPHFVRQGW